MQAIATRARTFDFFERTAVWQGIPERFRLHAVATQRAADRIAREIGYEHRDRLMVSSLLHDIGKLVLVHAYPGYPRQVHGDARTPEERIQRERRELGVDHALVGGVLARRWGLPKSIASVIERHHSEDSTARPRSSVSPTCSPTTCSAARSPPRELLAVGRTRRHEAGPAAHRALRPAAADLERSAPRQVDPCPMSTREVEVLRRLAKGMVYKQIATELGLSTSTVRTHLHNVYGKLGRDGPRPGRADRHRARLDLSATTGIPDPNQRSGDAVDHHQVALRAAGARRALSPRRQRAGADRRAGPPG